VQGFTSTIQTSKIVQCILVMTSILWPLAGASSSSSTVSTSDPDSSDDYREIRANACGESTEGDRLICMVALNVDRSRNNSNRYPTIGTLSGGLVRNLNPDFNIVRVQAIMETIQGMAPDGSPLLS
jgi:hypothetical protein